MQAIMVRAHEIARTLEGDYSARMSYALRQAWAEARAPKAMDIHGIKARYNGWCRGTCRKSVWGGDYIFKHNGKWICQMCAYDVWNYDAVNNVIDALQAEAEARVAAEKAEEERRAAEARAEAKRISSLDRDGIIAELRHYAGGISYEGGWGWQRIARRIPDQLFSAAYEAELVYRHPDTRQWVLVVVDDEAPDTSYDPRLMPEQYA